MKFRPLLFLPLLAISPALPAWAATPAKPAPARPAPAIAAPADPVAALLDQAREAQGRGEMELAFRLTEAAIVADPARTSSYVALGDLYSTQGQADYARTYYDAALEIDPSDAAARRGEAALGNAPKATAANTQ
jgi:Tfp pilus assembly protein PilF